MSRPLLATSVANKIGTLPDLNLARFDFVTHGSTISVARWAVGMLWLKRVDIF